MKIFIRFLLAVAVYVFSLVFLGNVAFIPGWSVWMFLLFMALPVAAFIWFLEAVVNGEFDENKSSDFFIKLVVMIVVLFALPYAFVIFIMGAVLDNQETAWCSYPLERMEFDDVVLFVSSNAFEGKASGCVFRKDDWLPIMERVGKFSYPIEEIEMLDGGVVRLRFENGKVEDFEI